MHAPVTAMGFNYAHVKNVTVVSSIPSKTTGMRRSLRDVPSSPERCRERCRTARVSVNVHMRNLVNHPLRTSRYIHGNYASHLVPETCWRRPHARQQRKTFALSSVETQRRLIDLSETVQDPYGCVEDWMTSCNIDGSGCKAATRDTLIKEVRSTLETFTGLPVTDAQGVCIGVLSDKDVAVAEELFRLPSKQNVMIEKGGVDNCTVGELMTTPPIVTTPKARVAYAAAVMLQNKIHRLPVVDNEGRLLGIVTRTDVFEPLLCDPEEKDCVSDPIYRGNPANPGSVVDIGRNAPAAGE